VCVRESERERENSHEGTCIVCVGVWVREREKERLREWVLERASLPFVNLQCVFVWAGGGGCEENSCAKEKVCEKASFR